MTSAGKIATGVCVATILFLMSFSAVSAMEPRPWLCRAKPVFSSSKPMNYEAVNRGAGSWVMTFMRFDLTGGHDGFTVAATRDVSGRVEGTLAPGQWYAVALYRQGSHWICPGNARENDRPAPGVISDLCYGEHLGECSVRLAVKPADASATTSHTAPRKSQTERQ